MIRDEINKIIQKQPVFDNKDKAIQAAIEAHKKPGDGIYEVWQEPPDRGGRYVVAESPAFEILYREKYKRILDTFTIADIERGDHIDEIEEV